MTWLAWRQSRLQLLIAACALLLLTLAFALTEPGLSHLSAEYGARPAAFLAQVIIGVTAGGALSLLPHHLIEGLADDRMQEAEIFVVNEHWHTLYPLGSTPIVAKDETAKLDS